MRKDKYTIVIICSVMILLLATLTAGADRNVSIIKEQQSKIKELQTSIDKGYKNGLHKYNLKPGMEWPVYDVLSSTITSRFFTYRPYNKANPIHFSTDIFQREEAYAKPMTGGVVTNIHYNKYWGWRTTITGNRYKVIYSHTEKPSIDIGLIIDTDKSFAKISNTGLYAVKKNGKRRPPHLCFMVYEWINGKWVLIDPIESKKSKKDYWQ